MRSSSWRRWCCADSSGTTSTVDQIERRPRRPFPWPSGLRLVLRPPLVVRVHRSPLRSARILSSSSPRRPPTRFSSFPALVRYLLKGSLAHVLAEGCSLGGKTFWTSRELDPKSSKNSKTSQAHRALFPPLRRTEGESILQAPPGEFAKPQGKPRTQRKSSVSIGHMPRQ